MSAPILAQSTAPAPFPAPKAKTKPKPQPSGSRPVDHTPLSLFPVQALWTIDLNSRLTQAPAYDDKRGYFAIEQNRIVAYDLNSGTRQWIAMTCCSWSSPRC
jgi:hypothetical protein